MKFVELKTISIHDLRDAIEAQYDVYIENVAGLLFGDDGYTNDSYKKLYFNDEGWKDDLKDSEDEDDIHTLLMLNFLSDCFPNDEYILVDVSW